MNILKLLKVRKNEKTKVFLFFLFALFLQAGVSIGESVSSSLFLVNVGFESLPYIYILIPVVITFVYIPIYTSFLKRYTEDRFFQIVLLFLTVMNVGIVFAIKYFKPFVDPELMNYLFYFIMIYTIVWATALYTLFWNFIDTFFDILDSKRIFAIFSAGTAFGAIVGGSLVSKLTQHMPAVDLLFGWSFFSFISLIAISIINKKFKKIPLEEEEEDLGGIVKQFSFMLKTILSSRYVFFLTTAFFVSIVLATTLEFEYMGILSKDQTEESLAALFGELFVIVNVFNLIVNFFFFNRLVLSYGVRNVTLIQPIGYILAFAYLSVSRETEAAIFGFFIVQGIAVAIDYNNQNLLYNGVKSNIKYRVRTFVENLGEPLAVAFTGFILIFMAKDTSPHFVGYMGEGMAFFYLICILYLRAEYPKSMVKNFKSDWLDFSYNSKKVIHSISSSGLEEVYKYKDTDHSNALALGIFSESKPLETLKELLPYLNSTSNINFEKNRFLLKNILSSSDSQVTKIVVDWVDANISTLSLRVVRELGTQGFISSNKFSSMLDSKDPKRQSTAIVLLLNSNIPSDVLRANTMINKLLESEDIESVCEGIYAIGESKHSEYAFFIEKFLSVTENKEIRLQALKSISTLSNTKINQLIPSILNIFKDLSSQEREISLEILRKIKDSQCIIPVLKKSDILTSIERRSIISLIEEFGLQTIPSVVTVLVEDKFSYPARSIAARTLGNLSFAQLKSLEEELIMKEIEIAYSHLYTHSHLENQLNEDSLTSLKLLSLFYKDIHQSSVEFILELLTIGGRLADFEMIKTAIKSVNSKSRGNAIETIEQSTDKKIFSLLLPLIDARSIQDSIEFYQSKFHVEKITNENIINNALLSKNELEQHIALDVIYQTDSQYKNIFRDMLIKSSSIKLKDAIFLLLNNKEKETEIYRLALLTQNSFFNKFNIFELALILKDSKLVDMKKGEEFFDNIYEYIYLKIDNKASENIIGIEYLFNKNLDLKKSYAEDMIYLRLSNESILQSIHSYPTIGISLAQEISSYETF